VANVRNVLIGGKGRNVAVFEKADTFADSFFTAEMRRRREDSSRMTKNNSASPRLCGKSL
jgi:hypothetical protein